MATEKVTRSKVEEVDVTAMRAGPVAGLKPISESPIEIDIDLIDLDPTNPGTATNSLRYERRDPSIRDSYDILGRVVYPIVVCESGKGDGRYVHVDGFGRLRQLKARNVKRVRAMVYPPMNLEQRIVFRQTLNAAQEPFDVASIIADLQKLAKERGIDLSDKKQVKTLIRDLPTKVQRYQNDLLILARWDPESAQALGESSSLFGTIGIDKLRALERVLDNAVDRHPKVVEEVGGEQGFTKRLTEMYLGQNFSKGSRSQEAIRKVTRALGNAESNSPLVRDFFVKKLDHSVLDELGARSDKPRDIRTACTKLIELVADVDASSLTDDERRVLRRTLAVLNDVLA